MKKNQPARLHHLPIRRFHQLLRDQGDACAICKDPFGETIPCIDHDHRCCPGSNSCGKCVRGLLCRGCNIMMGYYDRGLFAEAAEYQAAYEKRCLTDS